LKITITKIAEIVGVSKATVSRAINGSGYVSPQTKEKVLQVVKEYDYVPDSKAINLSKRKTATIGLVLPSTSGPFYGEVMRGVEVVLTPERYFILLMTFNVMEDPEKVRKRYISLVREKRVDGIIIFDPEADEETAKKVAKLNFPCVYIGKNFNNINVDTVSVDNFSGSYMMMDHLIKVHKYKRIAFLNGPEDSFDSIERFRGYRYALEEYGIGFDPKLVRFGDFTRKSGREICREFLESHVDVIFAANDEMALGVIEEMQKHNLVAGREMAVVGFDDAMWSQFIQPPLTTVHQPMYSIGKLAARMILERINTSDSHKEVMKTLLHTKLIVRNSCGCK